MAANGQKFNFEKNAAQKSHLDLANSSRSSDFYQNLEGTYHLALEKTKGGIRWR